MNLVPDDPRTLSREPLRERRIELTARLNCLECGALIHDQEPVEGRSWVRCVAVLRGGSGRHRQCGALSHVIVLPPGATGRDLAMVMGTRTASLLIRRLVPAAAELPDAILWEWKLAATDHAAFVQVQVTPYERHQHRWAEVPALLRALSLVA